MSTKKEKAKIIEDFALSSRISLKLKVLQYVIKYMLDDLDNDHNPQKLRGLKDSATIMLEQAAKINDLVKDLIKD